MYSEWRKGLYGTGTDRNLNDRKKKAGVIPAFLIYFVETPRNAVMYRIRILAILGLSLFVRYLIVQLDTLPVLSLIFTSKVRM